MSENKILECPGCGARITGGKRICDYCGSEIKVPEVKKESPGPTPEIQYNQQPQSQATSQSYSRPAYIQPVQKTTSGMAIASFVLSLLGIFPIAFILGIIASARISQPDSNLTGRGFAVTAIILSILQVLTLIIVYLYNSTVYAAY